MREGSLGYPPVNMRNRDILFKEQEGVTSVTLYLFTRGSEKSPIPSFAVYAVMSGELCYEGYYEGMDKFGDALDDYHNMKRIYLGKELGRNILDNE